MITTATATVAFVAAVAAAVVAAVVASAVTCYFSKKWPGNAVKKLGIDKGDMLESVEVAIKHVSVLSTHLLNVRQSILQNDAAKRSGVSFPPALPLAGDSSLSGEGDVRNSELAGPSTESKKKKYNKRKKKRRKKRGQVTNLHLLTNSWVAISIILVLLLLSVVFGLRGRSVGGGGDKKASSQFLRALMSRRFEAVEEPGQNSEQSLDLHEIFEVKADIEHKNPKDEMSAKVKLASNDKMDKAVDETEGGKRMDLYSPAGMGDILADNDDQGDQLEPVSSDKMAEATKDAGRDRDSNLHLAVADTEMNFQRHLESIDVSANSMNDAEGMGETRAYTTRGMGGNNPVSGAEMDDQVEHENMGLLAKAMNDADWGGETRAHLTQGKGGNGPIVDARMNEVDHGNMGVLAKATEGAEGRGPTRMLSRGMEGNGHVPGANMADQVEHESMSPFAKSTNDAGEVGDAHMQLTEDAGKHSPFVDAQVDDRVESASTGRITKAMNDTGGGDVHMQQPHGHPTNHTNDAEGEADVHAHLVESAVPSSASVHDSQSLSPAFGPAWINFPNCVCNQLNATNNTGFVNQPNTNCNEFIECSEGHVVREGSCLPDWIFKSDDGICAPPDSEACPSEVPLEGDYGCHCEYAKILCIRSMENLTADMTSEWELPLDCAYANDVCSAGDALYEGHTADTCKESLHTFDFESKCDGGVEQICFDQSMTTPVCNGVENKCDCNIFQEACDQGTDAVKSCSAYARECCEDAECKCSKMIESCSASLESLDNGELSEECLEAEEACCEDCPSPVKTLEAMEIEPCQCSCNFWDNFCARNPGPACDYLAGRCCGSPTDDTHNAQCYCEVYTHLGKNLNYDLNHTESCARAEETETSFEKERELLIDIYNELNGTNWLNNDLWLSNAKHCRWHGVGCNDADIVTSIELPGNNLVGIMNASRFFSEMYKLEKINLSNNTLKGSIDLNSFYQLRKLEHVDFSRNDLHGVVDVLLSPAIKYLDMSHNKFSSMIRFKSFKSSQNTLETLDLSYNDIHQDVSDFFDHIPPNLKFLILTNNHIHGILPIRLPVLENLEQLYMNHNNVTGQIPDVSLSSPRLKELDLSNQGLSGSIPGGWANLPDLVILDLSSNNLTGSIPIDVGNLFQLKILDVSNNGLESIPDAIGKLAANLEKFDASNNELEGKIPEGLGDFEVAGVVVNLVGNSALDVPAPLALCYVDGFDLAKDTRWCPEERNVLKEFYDSAKGMEWTESNNWTDPIVVHCNWLGVGCTNGTVTALVLPNNGLSGKLSPRIGELSFLEVLDLSDNDIKGKIPAEIGNLTHLTKMKLNSNSFVENVPEELAELKNLELVRLQGNRLAGTVPEIQIIGGNESSFITDCGAPFAYELECDNCTMCCNIQDDCYPKIEPLSGGFNVYSKLAWVFSVSMMGFYLLVALVAFFVNKCRATNQPATREQPTADDEDDYAFDAIGRQSVYLFFLGKNILGWLIALTTIGLQVTMLMIFVIAAEVNLSDEKSDLVYTWKCPRDKEYCEDKSDLTPLGWTMFGVLMGAHLLKDLINGAKLILHSAKADLHCNSRIRSFVGGMFLCSITVFVLFASALYNKAIATSNQEIIMNSVVILFIMDLDEFFFNILAVINKSWVDNRVPSTLETKVQTLEEKIKALTAKIEDLQRRAGTGDSPAVLHDSDSKDTPQDKHSAGSSDNPGGTEHEGMAAKPVLPGEVDRNVSGWDLLKRAKARASTHTGSYEAAGGVDGGDDSANISGMD